MSSTTTQSPRTGTTESVIARTSLFDFRNNIVEIKVTISDDDLIDIQDPSVSLTTEERRRHGLIEGENMWKHLGVPDYVVQDDIGTVTDADDTTLIIVPPAAVLFRGNSGADNFVVTTRADSLEDEVKTNSCADSSRIGRNGDMLKDGSPIAAHNRTQLSMETSKVAFPPTENAERRYDELEDQTSQQLKRFRV